jgi:monovalent cation/hydrogen antiporter
MEGTGIHGAQMILLLLLLFVAAFAALARRLQTPYPIVLVIAGLLLGFIPGIPKINLEPDLIFLVVLPPLLYAAAWVTSWREFSHNLVSIAMLAFGLVGFTVLGVAIAGPWLFHGFDWRIGFVLGAAVATTDAIAATSIAKRIGLPKRIVDLLEGESLLNDATGLLALEFAVAMVVHGQNPTASAGLLRLAYLIVAGIGSGLILARIVEWFEHRIDDGPIEIAVSILVPYAAYLTAEEIHASGSARGGSGRPLSGPEEFAISFAQRTAPGWSRLGLTHLHFERIRVCLNRPAASLGARRGERIEPEAAYFVRRSIQHIPDLAAAPVDVSGCVCCVLSFERRLLHQKERRPGVRQIFVVGWTGMRGVIALAAAMSLPQTTRRWQPVSPSGPDCVFDLLRHFGNAGVPRSDASSADSDFGYRGGAGPQVRRARSAPVGAGGCKGTS